jgi:hypothetical protein
MADGKLRVADDVGPGGAGEGRREFAHALIFTGHMIDRPDRTHPRFPAWAEARAREAIQDAIAELEWNQPGTTVGLAGGASGADLLFHECCAERGIPTRVLLALPPEEFKAESVAPAGGDWVARFESLLRKAGPGLRVMQDQDGLLEGPTNNVWQRANLWMIEEAGRLASEKALLALWDGNTGDGPGGTAHFVEIALHYGIRIVPPIRMQDVVEGEATSG